MEQRIMKRALLIALGLVTLAALPASAADLGRRPLPTKAPVMAEPVWNWTGFYIGVNGGAGWARSEHFTNVASTGLFNQNGGMVGGTIDADHLTAHWDEALRLAGQKGSVPSPALLRHVAPLGWEHISLTGNYIWMQDARPAPGQLRPLRERPSLLAA